MRAVDRDISRSVAPTMTSVKPSQSLGTGHRECSRAPTPARDATERARDCLRWAPSEAVARAFRTRSLSAPPTVICPDPQLSCTGRMGAVIICRPSLPNFGAIAANNGQKSVTKRVYGQRRLNLGSLPGRFFNHLSNSVSNHQPDARRRRSLQEYK